MSGDDPHLLGGPPHRRTVRSAVLLLHGGREVSAQATAPAQAAVLRMLDFYAGLRRQRSDAAIYLLRYRVRGWNGAGSSAAAPPSEPGSATEPAPVADARWALGQIRARCGDVPIALLGHSMGGRTAFAVADDHSVAGVCALAPWLPGGEPLPTFRADQRFVIAHGTADRTTSAAASLEFARRLRRAGGSVARFELSGGGHGLLQGPRLWHRFAVTVSLALAGDAALPSTVAASLHAAGADSDGLQVPLASAVGSR